MAEQQIPALLVGSTANRRYLSGFEGSYGWLLITPDTALLFTDSRYTIQATRQAPNFTLRQVSNPDRTLPTLLAESAAELGLAAISCVPATASGSGRRG